MRATSLNANRRPHSRQPLRRQPQWLGTARTVVMRAVLVSLLIAVGAISLAASPDGCRSATRRSYGSGPAIARDVVHMIVAAVAVEEGARLEEDRESAAAPHSLALLDGAEPPRRAGHSARAVAVAAAATPAKTTGPLPHSALLPGGSTSRGPPVV